MFAHPVVYRDIQPILHSIHFNESILIYFNSGANVTLQCQESGSHERKDNWNYPQNSTALFVKSSAFSSLLIKLSNSSLFHVSAYGNLYYSYISTGTLSFGYIKTMALTPILTNVCLMTRIVDTAVGANVPSFTSTRVLSASIPHISAVSIHTGVITGTDPLDLHRTFFFR